MFVTTGGAIVKGDILSLLVKLKVGRRSEPLREGELTGKLVGELSSCEHRFRVNAGSLREPGIEGQWRRSGTLARLIRQLQKLLFGLKLGIVEWDVGSGGRGGLQCGLWGRLGVVRGKSHQAAGWLHGRNSRAQQERQQ